MNVDEITAGEFKSLVKLMGNSNRHEQSHSFVVGRAYLIRTVTMHYTGRVVSVNDSDISLERAAWIADTGRYHNSLVDGALSEVEPYPGVVHVSRAVIVDFTEWKHELPESQS